MSFRNVSLTKILCYQYLTELKWTTGFVCPNCGHTNYCNGKRKYDRQCTSCHRITSPTSGTLFHQLKFSVLKAFYIVYYVSTSKKGISSTELSRKLGLRQKTCWKFKGKVMKAMKAVERTKLMVMPKLMKLLLAARKKVL